MSKRKLTAEDRAFYAGCVDVMTDDMKRAARDSSVRLALGRIAGPLSALSQSAGIRERTDRDEVTERVLRETRDLLASIERPEPPRRRARRRR